jgi:hypothetical protein
MLARIRGESCLSDLRLDELMLGALDPGERLRADAHLATCALCADRLAELEHDRDVHVPVPLAPRRFRPELAFGIAAAAAALLLVAPWPSGQGERSKGGPHLELLVRHGGDTRAAGPGERVHGGDTLTFVVTTNRPSFVSVLGLDGEGTVSVYVVSEAVDAGRDRSLPNAALLDATQGVERIYAVFCDARLEIEALRGGLGEDGVFAPPAGCSVDVATVEKTP